MIKRHWMSICLVLVFFTTTGILYYFYPHTDTNSHIPIFSKISLFSKSDEKGNSGTTIPIESIQTGTIDINTGTQNKTHSSFIFQKPNTEWKERDVTLNDGRTLHYVFGEGNPNEVALDKSELKIQSKELCNPKTSALKDISHFCNPENEEIQYVTPEIEQHLLEAFSDPNWIKLANICEKNLRFMEKDQKEQDTLSYDQVFQTNFLQIENFLSVDPQTGWKKLDGGTLRLLINFIEQGFYEYGRGEIIHNPYGNCVDNYATSILTNLRLVEINYENSLYPESFSGPIYTTYGVPIEENVTTGSLR